MERRVLWGRWMSCRRWASYAQLFAPRRNGCVNVRAASYVRCVRHARYVCSIDLCSCLSGQGRKPLLNPHGRRAHFCTQVSSLSYLIPSAN
jgi:hypothetical protein